MIIYDSKIARLLQGRLNPYDYVTLPLVTLTALLWRERHLGRDGDEHPPPAIHGMFLCVPAAVPAFGLAGMLGICRPAAVRLLPPLLAERLAVGHSAFDYEAEKESEEVSYFVVRKHFAWRKWYWKKELPAIDRSWFC